MFKNQSLKCMIELFCALFVKLPESMEGVTRASSAIHTLTTSFLISQWFQIVVRANIVQVAKFPLGII